MKLYLVPLWHETVRLVDDDYRLFEEVCQLISEDETLGSIFASYEILDRIIIPSLEKLNSRVRKSIFQKMKEILGILAFLSTSEIPYGDEAFETYTTRYMEEIAKELKWDSLNSRILALTNVTLRSYVGSPWNLQTFSQLSGKATSKKSVVVSVVQFRHNPSMIYKEAKHELGHTFKLFNCPTEYCIMNHKKDFAVRSFLYCPTCKSKIILE